MRTFPDPSSRVCAVCKRVLDYHSSGVWQHTSQDQEHEDHAPVPVPEPEVADPRFRCDFCNMDIQEAEDLWVVPAGSFGEDRTGGISVGDWAACPDCADIIEDDRWADLVDRVVAGYRHGKSPYAGLPIQMQRKILARLYRDLRRHLQGPPYQPKGAQ